MGSKFAKNTKLENEKTFNVSVAGLVGQTKTNDDTYTAEVASKYQNYVSVTPVSGGTNKFIVNAKGLKNNKDTKVTVTFKCDQNGKKANLSLTITK